MPLPDLLPLVSLTLTPGLGPRLIARALTRFGSAHAALHAAGADWEQISGVGPAKAAAIRRGLDAAEQAAARELDLAARLGVSLTPLQDVAYPPLLRLIPDPPPLLYHRGPLLPEHDKHAVALVGSRACTAYGVEQAERFSAFLAGAGLAVVSGGARGIDTAAHRAALRAGRRTVAVVGCGLSHCYPPENADLFREIGAGEGAVVSELPLQTPPAAENFPARNRVISGWSLGVIVIEAAKGSGALITARLAAEDHNREVMAVPGRIDSPASEGCNALLRDQHAAMLTSPADALDILEAPARFLHQGVHEHRYAASPAAPDATPEPPARTLFEPPAAAPRRPVDPAPANRERPIAHANLTPAQRSVLDALTQPRSLEELVRDTGLDPAGILPALTVLEVRRAIVRDGSRWARRG